MMQKSSTTAVRAIIVSTMAGVLMVLSLSQHGYGQSMAPDVAFEPRSYLCHQATGHLTIDGELDESSWQQANWSANFLDIEGPKAPTPRYNTQVKMLWDETHLYVAAKLEEPHVWGNLQQRDTVIFYNNNFEVFIDPDGDTHQYYELEVNALGTYWDLMLTKPYRDGGKAIDSWDMRGLEIGIAIDGTLNNPTDKDTGWTVELAIPWKDLAEASADGEKPSVGDQWRINFSRVQWKHRIVDGKYSKALNPQTEEPLAEDNWVWSPQGVINMHYPEMWGFVQFAAKGDTDQSVTLPNEEYIKWYLRQLYYRQHDYHQQEALFAKNPDALEAGKLFRESALPEMYPAAVVPTIYATPHTFEIRLPGPADKNIWYIRNNGHVWSKRSQ